jgi:hypothetical protein
MSRFSISLCFDMTAADFHRLALSLPGAAEGSHMGQVDFRVGGHIFATLASVRQGYGNLMLTPEQQAAFVSELPELFLPVAGGWGRMGVTHLRLSAAHEDIAAGALRTAWKLRVEKNEKGKRSRGALSPAVRTSSPRSATRPRQASSGRVDSRRTSPAREGRGPRGASQSRKRRRS